MRIQNIPNRANDECYEASVIGSKQEVEAYSAFSAFTTDFIEEEGDGKFSITVMSSWFVNKKEFKDELVQDLKKFRAFLATKTNNI
jgi:hypothetical protein